MSWGNAICTGLSGQAVRALCAGLLAASCVAAAPAALAAPGDNASATGSSQVAVITALSLINTADLSFGRFTAGPAAGTVTVDPIAGGCTVTGPIVHAGGCSPAEFVGMGTRNMGARVSLSGVTNLTGPGQTMVLDSVWLAPNSSITFTGNPHANGQGIGLTQGNGNQRYSISSSSGIFTLRVGGRLNVNANQAPGVYTGSISITVQYQ